MNQDEAVVSMLLSLQELNDIGDVALLALARDAKVERLRKGEKLQADAHLDRHVFLVEGEVHLFADGKTMDTVRAGTERARRSLFRVNTHGLYAKCVKESALLSLDEQTYKHYVKRPAYRRDEGIQVEEYVPDESGASLIREVAAQFNHQEVDLPSLPEVAKRVFKGLDHENLSVREVAEILQSDPVIAARIIQVANSALYSHAHVTGVAEAVSLIGFKAVRAIVMSVVARSLYSPRAATIKHRMKQFYVHSVRVGAIAHALCRHIDGFEPDYAFLAGLIHDMGTIPLLVEADKRDEFQANPPLLETMLQQLGHQVGARLLQQWEFEPQLVTVAKESEEWQREVQTPDYCDVIQVAQLHCPLVGGRRLEAPPLSELPAFRRLNLQAIDPLKLVNDARQEVHEVVSLLAGS